MSTITSGLFKLGLRDAVQGLIMAAGGAAFGVISESISKGVFTLDFTAIWHSALAASVVYIGKKFFTPAQEIKPAN